MIRKSKKEKFISDKIVEWCTGREEILYMPIRPLSEPCTDDDNKTIKNWAYNGILIVGQMIINEDHMSLVSKSLRTGRFVSDDEQQSDDYSPVDFMNKLFDEIKNLSAKDGREPIVIFMRSEAEKLYKEKLDGIEAEKRYQQNIIKARRSIGKIAGYKKLNL